MGPEPAAQSSRRARVRNYIAWCFAISLAVHVAGGAYLEQFATRPALPLPQASPDFTIVRPLPVPTPKPKPKPPEHARAHPPPQSRPIVAVHVPPRARATTVAVSAVPSGLGPSTEGGGSGLPVGVGSGTPGAAGTGDSPTLPLPSTMVKPEPSCSVPNVEAHTLSKASAEYPERAGGAGGETQVEVTLDERGAVTNVAVHVSSGNTYLDQAALRAARSATYAPEIRDCQRVSGSYLFVADFAAQ
jgi:protein TonB